MTEGEDDGRVCESLFQMSFKAANSWFDRLTPNGLEPETFVLSLSKNEIRRLMQHPQRRRRYTRWERAAWGLPGGWFVDWAAGGVDDGIGELGVAEEFSVPSGDVGRKTRSSHKRTRRASAGPGNGARNADDAIKSLSHGMHWKSEVAVVRDDKRFVEVADTGIKQQMRGQVHVGSLLVCPKHFHHPATFRSRH